MKSEKEITEILLGMVFQTIHYNLKNHKEEITWQTYHKWCGKDLINQLVSSKIMLLMNLLEISQEDMIQIFNLQLDNVKKIINEK